MTHLDLFSGIGGFALGLRMAGCFETVAFCESDPFCQQVLKKHWPDVPIFDDIKILKGRDIGTVGIVTGGAPCQPFSVAGKQRGTADDRWLWPEMFRIVHETNPTWVIFENVPGIVNMALEQMLTDMESEGYDTQTFIVPACAINAPHRRNRVWIVAHSSSKRRQQESCSTYGHESQNGREPTATDKPTSRCQGNQSWSMADTTSILSQRQYHRPWEIESWRSHRRSPQPKVGRKNDGLPSWMDRSLTNPWAGDWEGDTPRVASGIPNRVNRLKALGNSVVPQIVAEIGRIIQLVENQAC